MRAPLAALNLFACLVFAAPSAADAPKTELLWAKGAPGALGDKPTDQPSLTVYLPPADKATGTGVVVCPGGGYGGLAVNHEGKDIAEWFNKQGVAAFVLRYRVAPYKHPAPMLDAQRAVRTVRARAKDWGVDPKRLGIMGFSAGGHLASTVATHFDDGKADADDPIDRVSCRPDFAVLCYPVITLKPPYAHMGSRHNLLGKDADEKLVESLCNDEQVTDRTPPTFLFHTDADSGVKPENSILFYLALKKAKVPAEMHIYEKGPHGVGLAPNDPILSTWSDRLAGWLKTRGLLAPALPKPPPPPPEDPADVKAKAVVAYTPAFSCYVFNGAPFPTLVSVPNEALEKLIGPCTFKITFFDRDHREVTRAERPGPYGAVIELKPKEGPAVRRFVTLCRIEGDVKGDERLDPAMLTNVRRPFGLPEGALHREDKLVAEVLKNRTFAEWSRDPRAGRLFAGLFLADGDKAATKADDAFARERQFWVDRKRKLYGWDKVNPKSIIAPAPLEGKPAPVVRQGTLAEAGMKPDAADKIDAVLQQFAADTDQAFAVCIVRHGVIVLHKGYGERDGKPMTVDTKSWMASITKTMAATTMLMLIDQGLVSFDDPVDKFLPPLRGIKVEKALLVRNLYTHTNGIEKLPWNDEMPDIEERLTGFYERAKVGKVWAYGGNGNILGGKIVEAISGEAVPLFYKRHLLDPLGCTGTDVIGTHADARSIPLDMAKFGQMLLNRGTYADKRFFKAETFEQMLPRVLTKELGEDAKKSFGFGLDGSAKKFGHGAASAATFSVDAEADLVVVMTRDKQGKNQDRYNGKFWDAIRAGMMPDK